MLRQPETWGLIEDLVKGGYESENIAQILLAEMPEVAEHYATNKQAKQTLGRLIRKYVQLHIPIKERFGVTKLRAYIDREIGVDVIKELKSAIVMQKERVGRTVEWENRLNIPNVASGKEVERLGKLLGTLGQLLIAAGMNLHEEEVLDIIDVQPSEGGGYAKLVMEELKKQGVVERKASEVATGIPALTDGKPA